MQPRGRFSICRFLLQPSNLLLEFSRDQKFRMFSKHTVQWYIPFLHFSLLNKIDIFLAEIFKNSYCLANYDKDNESAFPLFDLLLLDTT